MKRGCPLTFAVDFSEKADLVSPAVRWNMLNLLCEREVLPWHTAYALDIEIYKRTNGNNNAYTLDAKKLLYNLMINPCLRGVEPSVLAAMDDYAMRQNTILDKIDKDELLRTARFESMLQERYESIEDGSSHGRLICRKCNSKKVEWQQKQTRGADEVCSSHS